MSKSGEITTVDAWEVLDSRGQPTVRAEVMTNHGSGEFTVPAGASTGRFEAVERRDGEERFGGAGVIGAVEAVVNELAPLVVGRDVRDQVGLDATLVQADGTDDLSQLGANAVLAVSGAALKAASDTNNVPLYRYLADQRGFEPTIPIPMVNILSGGLHAEGGIEVQDFLVIPHQVESATEAIETVWSVRNSVRSLIVEAGHRPLVADEGGFAPPMDTIDDAFDLLISGIKHASYVPGDDVSIGIDIAASHFYNNESDQYRLDSADKTLTREEMIALVVGWTETYPVVSVEDPLAESDWAGWGQLADQLDDDVQLLGDDLLVTDTDRLHQAVSAGTVSAILIKPNQAGTISRAINVVGDAKTNEIKPVVSARSGETCDATIADLAVGLDAGQIKIGSLARSERLAKYNRLLEIERTASLAVRDPFVE